jgi:hypothetical protein
MNADLNDVLMTNMGLILVFNPCGFFPGAKKGEDLRYSVFTGYYYF